MSTSQPRPARTVRRTAAGSTCRAHSAIWAAWLVLVAGNAVARADNTACLTAHEQSQRLRLDNHLLAAREQLLICAQTDCPRLVTDDCVGWLAEVEQSVASIVFAVSDERGNDITNAQVWNGDVVLAEHTDGRALTLDPGSYALRFERAGYATVTVQLAIRQSEKNRIVRVQLRPLPVPAAADSGGAQVPIASYVLGGVALAAAGAGAYFAVAGKNEYDDLERTCNPTCSADQVAAGKRDYVIADVAFGVAAASAVAAALVFFIDRESPRQAASVQAAVTPHGAYVQLGARL